MDIRDTNIEDLHANLNNSEKACKKLQSDIEHMQSERDKLRTMEKSHRELLQERSMEKRTLIELREQLVEEKLKRERLEDHVDSVNAQMKQLGIDYPQVGNEAISEE